MKKKFYRIMGGVSILILYLLYTSYPYILNLETSNEIYLNCYSEHKFENRNCGYDFKNCSDINICKELEKKYIDKEIIHNTISSFPSGFIVVIFLPTTIIGIYPNFLTGIIILIFNSLFYFILGFFMAWLIQKIFFSKNDISK